MVATKTTSLRGKRGTVYRRFGASYGNVQLSQTYPDLVNNGDNTDGAKIRGGTDVMNTITSFEIPKGPSFGGGVLDGIDIFLFGDTVIQGNSSKPPDVVAYLLKSDNLLGSQLHTSSGGASMTSYEVGDVTVHAKDIVVGTSQIEDYFPSITCDYFTGTQEGWATDEITVTNQRQSKTKGESGGLYLTPEAAYEICYISKPYTSRGYTAAAMKLSNCDWSSIALLRQKHATGYGGYLNPTANGEDMGRMITLTSDSTDGWYKTNINLAGKHNQVKYFKEEEVASLIKQDDNVVLSDSKVYGDEVTSDNTFFSQVRGSGEYFAGALEDTGTELQHTIVKAGTVRFTSDNVITKGKCCQLYTFCDAGDTIHVAEPRALDTSTTIGEDGIEAVVDAVVTLGPLPMPCGPIPFPTGAAKNEAGHASANHKVNNYGGYSTGKIEITFTIPKMSTASEWHYNNGSGTEYDVVDVGRRSIVFAFSYEKPDISNSRFYDFWRKSKANTFASVVLIKDPQMGEGSNYGGGIWAFNGNTMHDGSSLAHFESVRCAGAQLEAPASANCLGPLSEGETYTMTFNIPTAHGTGQDGLMCTIHSQPETDMPNGRLILDEDQSTGYLNVTRLDSLNDEDSFSVVEYTGSTHLAGTAFDTNNEWYRYLSVWNNNSQNQKSASVYQGYTYAYSSLADSALSSTEIDTEIQLNIDNMRVGNYNVPMLNNTVIPTRKDFGLSNSDKASSMITISGSNSRTVQSSVASTWTQNAAGNFDQEGRYARAVTAAGEDSNHHDYGKGKHPGYTIINLGSNTADDLFSASQRYLFLNGFACSNLANNDALVNHDNCMIGGGFYSGVMSNVTNKSLVPLGFQGCVNSMVNKTMWYDSGETGADSISTGVDTGNNDHHITVATATSQTTATANNSCTMWVDGFGSSSDLGDVKGFQQKGLIRLPAEAYNGLTPNVGKRENFFMSAKILNFDTTTGIATVDTVEPFKNGSDIKYIAYIMGGHANTTSMSKVDIPLLKIIDQNHVELKWSGHAASGDKMWTKDKICGLWISPYLYWLSFTIMNWSGFTEGSYSHDADLDLDYANYNMYSAEVLPQKTYTSALITSDLGTLGATYNESMYESEGTTTVGATENSWDLNPTKDSALINLNDYGFGPFKEIDEGGQGFSGGYAMQGAPYRGGWWGLYDRDIVQKGKLTPGDKLELILQPKDISVDHTITYVAVDNTIHDTSSYNTVGKRPKIIANFFDELPNPLQNVRLEADKDGVNPIIKWDPPQDTDLWYAQVFIDDEAIQNNKHKAFIYMPLNEESSARGPFSDLPSNIAYDSSNADADHYSKYYNFQNAERRAAVIPNQHYQSPAGQFNNSAWNHYDTSIGIRFRPDGLKGMRIADKLTYDLDFVSDSDLKYAINSSCGIKIVPSNTISAHYSYGGSADVFYKQSVNPATTPLTQYISNADDSTKSWSTGSSDRPSSEITVGVIVYPMAYPAPEYTLKAESDGTTPVTIVNGGGTALSSITTNKLITSSAVKVNGKGLFSHSSSYLTAITSSTTDVYRYSVVNDTLAKIPTASDNGGLTNSEYMTIIPFGTTVSASFVKYSYTPSDATDNVGLYGTGSAVGGGGTAGVPTHGGNITIIPRSFIWRMGTGTIKLDSSDEKMICYLDSSGLVNVWCKILNQNEWLKLQSITAIPKDGTTPTHIGVTFDKDLPRGNLKLYINGKLESFTGDKATVGTSIQLQSDANGQGGEPLDLQGNDLIIDLMGRVVGSYSNTSGSNMGPSNEVADGMFGRMEEFSVLPYCTYFVNPSDGEFPIEKPFKELNDTSDATPIGHFAKIFLYDYHNIRGDTSDELQQTNNISWRKAAFSLDMS